MRHPPGKPGLPGAAPPELDPSADPSSGSPVAVWPIALLMARSFHVRANDERDTLKAVPSPLWIIAAGVVWLLGVAASVLVVSGAYIDGFADGEDGFDRSPMPIEMRREPADMPTQDSGINVRAIEDSRP